MASYKLEKEEFVSGHTGSSITHINSISSIALTSVALYLALQTRLGFPARLSPSGKHNLLELAAEFTLLVVPLLLSLTVFANYPLTLASSSLYPPISYVHTCLLSLSRLPLHSYPSFTSDESACFTSSYPHLDKTKPLFNPCSAYAHTIANTSSHSLFATGCSGCSASSGTDNIPSTYDAHDSALHSRRRLSGVPERTWQVRILGRFCDGPGVGSFVFSQGLVSAIPMIKNPSMLRAAVIPKLLVTVKKVVPVFVLGLVRVLAVKGTEYPEHVTEYGVHWNFFITLALLPPVSVLFHPLIVHIPLSILGLFVTLVHQIVLNNTPLQLWALGNDRSSLLSQNKEGIVSFVGYLALHLLGLAIGTLILPPSPSHFRRALSGLSNLNPSAAPSRAPSPARLYVDNDLHMGRRAPTPDSSDDEDDTPRPRPAPIPVRDEPRKRGKAAIELCSYAVVWWTLFFIGSMVGNGTQSVSRRLANTLYVLWVAAFNTSFLLGYVLLDSVFARPSHLHASRSSGFPAAKERLSASSPMRNSFAAPSFKFPAGSDSIRERALLTETDSSGLLAAINLNGLPLFLVANVATGLVNMSIRTMYAADGTRSSFCSCMRLLSRFVPGSSRGGVCCRWFEMSEID
ncbi:hypothetical protein RhiJN_12901 [Ceratobasidium sp. AG-Ba]|nr:hypothetical protein RhiJN_12901 [Ceratobasidium sp. AG-Ba]